MGCDRDGYEKTECTSEENIKKDILSCGGIRIMKNTN